MQNEMVLYKGRFFEMSEQGKKKRKKKNTDVIKINVVSTVLGTIIATAIVGSITVVTNTAITQNTVKSISQELDTIKNNTSLLLTDVSGLKAGMEGMNQRLKNVEDVQKILTLSLIDNAQIGTVSGHIENETRMAAPNWSSEQVIAIDKDGKEYTANELVNKKVLLSYKEGKQDVFFYGQFNAKNHWDGDCLINVYEDGKLIIATEANYSDGELLKYKQAIADRTSRKKPVWIVSDRIVSGDKNFGDSCNYYSNGLEYKEEFGYKNISISDLVYVDSIKEGLSYYKEAFYHGNTSGGYYNDDTGSAYLIKYAEDGTVRTLYCGRFVDGSFDDTTGEAWYITRNVETNTDYMYYKGNFVKNTTQNNAGSEFQNNLSMEDINNIVFGYSFDSELRWYE